MAQTFFPRKSIMVPASPGGHPPNTEYKVSYGDEKWGSTFAEVYKVQMVYNGVVAGRISPSFPIGTDDYLRVHEVVMHLLNMYNNNGHAGENSHRE